MAGWFQGAMSMALNQLYATACDAVSCICIAPNSMYQSVRMGRLCLCMRHVCRGSVLRIVHGGWGANCQWCVLRCAECRT